MRKENEINIKTKLSLSQSISLYLDVDYYFFCTKKSITDYYVTIEAKEEVSVKCSANVWVESALSA